MCWARRKKCRQMYSHWNLTLSVIGEMNVHLNSMAPSLLIALVASLKSHWASLGMFSTESVLANRQHPKAFISHINSTIATVMYTFNNVNNYYYQFWLPYSIIFHAVRSNLCHLLFNPTTLTFWTQGHNHTIVPQGTKFCYAIFIILTVSFSRNTLDLD